MLAALSELLAPTCSLLEARGGLTGKGGLPGKLAKVVIEGALEDE